MAAIAFVSSDVLAQDVGPAEPPPIPPPVAQPPAAAAPGTPPVTAEVAPGGDIAVEAPPVKPAEGIDLPAPAPSSPEPSAAAAAQTPARAGRPLEKRDDPAIPGYLPGYHSYPALGQSPHAPDVPALPGGMTGGFGAKMPFKDWTFRFAGFMTASLQYSTDQRERRADGQHELVFHTTPTTVEEYNNFLSTASVPGNWVSLRLSYGTSKVTANVSIDTWNPSAPTTYYGIGSQYFINNAFLAYKPGDVGPLRLRFEVGRLQSSYGGLSRYGSGIYTNTVSGFVQGVGERAIAEVDLTDSWMLTLEHGFMGARDGQAPSNIIPGPVTGWRRRSWASSWIHHAHLGLTMKSEPEFQVQLHYISNWSQEDRNDAPFDNPGTQAVDESNVKDGRLDAFSGDVRLISKTWGYLAGGVAYIKGDHSFPIKGFNTYGGEGEQLTDRFWGVTSLGTGTLLVGALNYGVSLGHVVNPDFGGYGPDVVLNTGVHVVTTTTDYEPYDGRVRHKYGLDALYTFLRNMGAGARFDRVVPDSKIPEETFHVLAGRLQFKSDWTSRDTIQLMYAKWFYGPRTRNEGTGLRTPERLDDQLFALNFSMWW